MKEENNYDISFFKPSSDFSRKNRNLVLYLVLIWAVAVFGFQVFLKMVEKPTPESILTEYLQVKDQVFTPDGTENDKAILLKSLINLANKNTINKSTEKPVILHAINWTANQLLINSDQAKQELAKIQTAKDNMLSLNNLDDYRAEKLKINSLQTEFLKNNSELKLAPTGIRGEIFMSIIDLNMVSELSAEEIAAIPGMMNKYFIHNQSFLTDTTFLGFPFHYFYTAVFLLVLFIALCYVYAMQVDRLNKRFGIVE